MVAETSTMLCSVYHLYFSPYRVFQLSRMPLQTVFSIPSRGISQAENGDHALRWDLSPAEIKAQTDNLINRTKSAYDHIGSLDVETVSVQNALLPLANAKFNYAGTYNVFTTTNVPHTMLYVFMYIYILTLFVFILLQPHAMFLISPSLCRPARRCDPQAPRRRKSWLSLTWK